MKSTRVAVKGVRTSHPVHLLVVTVATFAGMLALGIASASAALIHPFVSSFDGIATPAGKFSPWGVVVDNSSSASAGDVYVSDQTGALIDKFSGSGEYLCQITGAGDSSTSLSECNTTAPGVPSGAFSGGEVGRGQSGVDGNGNLFVVDPNGHVVDEFGPTGVYIGQIEVPGAGIPRAIAIDAGNDVFIADSAHGVIYKFDPVTKETKVFANESPGGHLGSTWGVAVDNDPTSPAHGDVYAVDFQNRVVDVFDVTGKYLSQLTGTPSGAFSSVFRATVDPSSGDVYVTAGGVVDEFDPEGAFLTETSVPGGGSTLTVAVAASTGDLYVGDVAHGKMEVFGPAVRIPDLSGPETANLEPTSITVLDDVDPAGGGEVISCEVEYGTSSEVYGETAPCSPALPYATPTAVSATLTGLTPNTTYHFRIVAGNANGTGRTYDGVFETTGPATVGKESASSITHNAATLQAQINPHGFDTTYQVEYGETEAYGNTVPVSPIDIGLGVIPQAVSQSISGLGIGKVYHYRFVATSSEGIVYGPDTTFTTEPPVEVEDETWVAGPHEATLQAKIEDFGTSTACEVEYVTDAQYARSGYTDPTIIECTPAHLAGSEAELDPIARPDGLAAGTIYHFRFFLSNEYGEQRTADQTVSTFGLAGFSVEDIEQESHPYTQAGGHPYELITNVDVNTTTDHLGNIAPTGTVKDIRVQLPPGLIGDPQATAMCTRYDSEQQQCSGASQVGLVEVKLAGGEPIQPEPLFNIVPPHGVAAEFGVRFNKFASAFIDASVRTGSGYGIEADSLNITTLDVVTGVRVTLWGVPADPSHDAQRSCPEVGGYQPPPCSISAPLRPFLTNPSACSRSLAANVQADTYQAPGEFAELSAEMPAITGCERLHFTPSIEVRPEASAADSPTGLHVDLHVPQEESASGLAEADLKDAAVTLPAGMVVNPSGAGGLTACSEAQIELHGPRPATCPESSKVGIVELVSPLIDHPLHGAVYVAQQGNGGSSQGSNTFGSLIVLYVAIDDPQTGVVVKLAGKVTLDPETGRLTTTVSESPQLPFEDLKLDFFGGPRAVLATPAACGSSAASDSFTSWAEPSSVVSPAAQPFAITSGPSGAPCPSGGFAPAFTAGTHSAQAGAFTPFVLSLTRQDGEPSLSGLEVTLSPGLLAKLAGVPLCGSTEAEAGACPATSQIGTVTAAAGVGPEPIGVQGGVYLTGPYNGGPFGEVVEVPAVAGPFNLGTVVVRGAIRVNPFTAQATVVSDQFPTILQGVPLHLKRVAVTLDRPGFTFNPTNCNQFAVSGKIIGTGGASVAVSAPFQVSNCADLPFKPGFAVSTQAKSSKAGGASLHVKITSGVGQANLAKIKVALPKQLPSRFSTLQKACLAAVFAANPASCPAGSLVGTVKAITPLLKAPFTGGSYLVSHGGAGTPDLELVLKSEGITLIEDGKTKIKNGITTSTFNTIPDAPISTIELTLPEGPHSALASFLPAKAKYNMCGQKLLMPTQITGQNGVVITQTTKITPTGCPTHKKAKAGRASKRKG